MESIRSTSYFIHFQEKAYSELKTYIESGGFSKIFVLTDSNTRNFCLPVFAEAMDLSSFEIIEILPGEAHKNIETCAFLWNELTERDADRKSLMINLGGGVITDMGGFVAATFKRGIRFVNIPTTLLSMVDASVGSKTGVDLGVLKNQIGLFTDPDMVLIDPDFLKTVSEREIRSGMAEIIKYGITFDRNLWKNIQTSDISDLEVVNQLIHRSIAIKNEVVLKDLKESKLRKTLNFGHTIGHAIESYFLENEGKTSLTHGEAVAVGMVVELYYASALFGFPEKEMENLKRFTHAYFGKIDLKESDFTSIVNYLKYDKKNVSGNVNFVLARDLEDCVIDARVPDNLIEEGLKYYMR